MAAVEDQCVFLEQIGSSRDEVTSWIQAQVEALENCLENPSANANIPSVLHKYKSELPSKEEIFEALCKNIQGLEDVRGNQTLPELRETQQNIDYLLAHAAELGETLEARQEENEAQKREYQGNYTDLMARVQTLKDKLVTAENTAGSDREVLQRIEDTAVSLS